MEYVVAAVILLVVLVVGAVGLVVPRMRRRELPPPPAPGSTTTLERPPAAPTVPPVEEEIPPLIEPPAPVVAEEPPAPVVVEEPVLEKPEPSVGRLVRLRARLARSQTVLGRGLLSVLSRDHLEDDDWDEIEESLITADVGVEATQVIVERLRERVRILGTRSVSEVRDQLAEELVAALEPEMDRSLRTAPHDGRPAVVLVVGVNGAGKTTTCGKIGRVLIADGRTVLFGAADTFRAAAADQIQTWGERVGAETVRGPEGGDPASVAFDAVKRGIDTSVDTVLIDTAGRLQNKVGLMDELGKVKRVVEKHGPVDETLLVLDATTGQNGLEQARVFTEVVDVTGVVLTKLDGTAKGGIVIAVQRKLGIPVKLVGLGEGPDDLAPFEPAAFVEALLGGDA
ncbi:signal recognition particle-docking protein FtsY [Actinoplanes hulinensis]|uniref:Signal recognition particle receptor FtsY n=1 Tax=Actinoplanes hulinensis TaxID=1144547 RepID=A0ABS7BBR5_9ACTN|nr:signal recognition particle-docking protein FtsY [Actinoplanes hulinensis]MBW6437874.1 signal recognition particle-docking protein FtsY [Actinoplanes hulinensis]